MRAPRIDARMRRDALLASPFFHPMQPAEIDEILSFAVERRFPRGAAIYAKGDPGSSMMAVLAGRLRITSATPEGKEVTLNSIGPGEIVGEIALLDGKPRSADVVAAEDTTVLVIERADFLPFLLCHPVLVEAILSVLCERLRSTSLALEEIALFDLTARLARLITKLATDYGRPAEEGVRIELKLSQSDLAALVASSRESVNKQLAQWRSAGLIGTEAGHITVLRPQALRALCP
jgi:CRP-like cAMP-binding protein